MELEQYDRLVRGWPLGLEIIRAHAKALRLPTTDTLDLARRAVWPLETFLEHLLTQEVIGRRDSQITRLTRAAHLPPGKTLEVCDQSRLPLRLRRQRPHLREGEFIGRAENFLIFGLPGTGKTIWSPLWPSSGPSAATAFCSYPPSSWLTAYHGRRETMNRRRGCVVQIVSRSSTITTWATPSRAARRWKSCSRSCPKGTNAAAS